MCGLTGESQEGFPAIASRETRTSGTNRSFCNLLRDFLPLVTQSSKESSKHKCKEQLMNTQKPTAFRCKLCRSTRTRKEYLLKGSGTLGGESPDFWAATCAECRLFQVLYDWEEVPPLEITTMHDENLEKRPDADVTAHIVKNSVFAEALSKTGSLAGKKILEIGCGSGFFLKACRDLGALSVTGQEFRNADVQYAKVHFGINDVRTEPLDNREAWPDGEFDIVCSLDVVEHVHGLMEFFDGALRVLKPGGLFFHATPGYDCLAHVTGRLLSSLGVGLGTTLCNVQYISNLTGGPHTLTLGKRQLEWLSQHRPLSITDQHYTHSYSYSDDHYRNMIPFLRKLPRVLAIMIFKLARKLNKNKLVFLAKDLRTQ
jgi:SAM-dependent methyltransferase